MEYNQEAIEEQLRAFLPADEFNLSAPCQALLLNAGKRWRVRLMLSYYDYLVSVLPCSAPPPLSSADMQKLAPLVEAIHTASLIHDDIEDNSSTRRGCPSAHKAFGVDTAINSGSWLYFKAATSICSLGCSAEVQNRLFRAYFSAIISLHEGQSIDIFFHKSTLFPTIEQYKAMVDGKTGSLAKLAIEIACIGAGVSTQKLGSAKDGASKFALAFQILDDAKNLSGDIAGKEVADDLIEGKRSYPVVLHVASFNDDGEKVLDAFKVAQQNGVSQQLVSSFLSMLEASNALSLSRQHANQLLQDSLAALLGDDATKPAAKPVSRLLVGLSK